MRSTLRAVFFLSVFPCIPIAFALMFWIFSSSCPKQYTLMDTTSLPVHSLVHQKWTGNLSNKIKDPSQNNNPSQPAKNSFHVSIQDIVLSEHEDIEVRGKFQQERIDKFCRHNFITRERENPEGSALKAFYRHLMFDDEHKVIYCFIPKVGCTNLKRLMLYMGGHLPMETVDWPWVEDSIYLEPALKHASLLNKTLTQDQKLQRIHDYYKFMIVRNPLERLVSAYRNKVEKSVRYDRQRAFPESIKIDILRKYRGAELKYWQLTQKDNPFNISVTFSEFIRYVVDNSILDMNEHFQPMMDICHPCLIKYNFYGNFRNISVDVRGLIAKFGTSSRFYRDQSLHSTQEQTSVLMAKYYNTLTQRDKVQLVGAWYDEILFYYTLYPSERESHRHILLIDIPVL